MFSSDYIDVKDRGRFVICVLCKYLLGHVPLQGHSIVWCARCNLSDHNERCSKVREYYY